MSIGLGFKILIWLFLWAIIFSTFDPPYPRALMVLGDSIAVGIGQALRAETHARVGASSCAIVQMAPAASYDTVVISAGINDPPGPCLETLREHVHAGRVIWILPAPINSARAHVADIAIAHGDRTVSYLAGPDHIHPRSYGSLAAAIIGGS